MTRANVIDPEPTYKPIPPEPWGRRLARVRQDVAGMTLAEAMRAASRVMLTTDVTISRLEALPVVPAGPRQGSRRQLAYVLCRSYRVDPEEFGLSENDLPPGMRASVTRVKRATVTPLFTPRELVAA